MAHASIIIIYVWSLDEICYINKYFLFIKKCHEKNHLPAWCCSNLRKHEEKWGLGTSALHPAVEPDVTEMLGCFKQVLFVVGEHYKLRCL